MRSFVVRRRCSTAVSSSPATPRTSSRRPARKGSTSRSPTSACSPRRSSGSSRAATDSGLDGYSDACLRRVWRAQHFSWWMTSMLHRLPAPTRSSSKLQLSQLRYVSLGRRGHDARGELRRARRRWPSLDAARARANAPGRDCRRRRRSCCRDPSVGPEPPLDYPGYRSTRAARADAAARPAAARSSHELDRAACSASDASSEPTPT